MDNLENKSSIQTDATDLQAEFDALRHLVVSILILLIVVSGTFSLYLLRQWRTSSKDLAIMRQQAGPMIEIYQKQEVPYMQEIVKKLTDYGQTHPDYRSVLGRYIKSGATTGAPPATATSPTPAPQKK
jgi:hypothetical protein